MTDVTAQAFREAAARHRGHASSWAASAAAQPSPPYRDHAQSVAEQFAGDAALLLAAAEQREQLAAFLYEERLMHADLAAFVTDCSTPTFQLVRNALEQIANLTAERDTARAEVVALDKEASTLRAERDAAQADLTECRDLLAYVKEECDIEWRHALAYVEAERDDFKAKFDRCFDAFEARLKERDAVLVLAREAANGWACYATRKIEHDDISRIHQALDALRTPR